jgi:hypothetical protein
VFIVGYVALLAARSASVSGNHTWGWARTAGLLVAAAALLASALDIVDDA